MPQMNRLIHSLLIGVLACAFALPGTAQTSWIWNAYDGFPLANNAVLGGGTYTTPDGPEVFVCGDFWPDGSVAEYVARWNPTLGWRPIGPPWFNGAATAVAGYDDGSGPALYVCGYFTSPQCGIMRTRFTAGWEGLATSGFTNMNIVATCRPSEMLVHDDGTGTGLYVAGEFGGGGQQMGTTTFGVPSRNVIRYDGSGWHSLAGGVDNGRVYSLCSFDDGSGPALFVGGSFTSIGGQPIAYVARWQNGAWSSVGQVAVDFWVSALAVFDDGNGPALYANARVGTTYLQKWTGTQWVAPQPQPPGPIHRMIAFDDGRGRGLICSMYGSAPSNHVGRWDGLAWGGMGGGVWSSAGGLPIGSMVPFDAGRGTELHFIGTLNRAGGGVVSYAVTSWRNLEPGGMTRLCTGDGTYSECPCAGLGASARGCPNSFDSGGADLAAQGVTQDDSLTLIASAMPPSAAALLFQGTEFNSNGRYSGSTSPFFGDGLRCAAGSLRRLVMKAAVGGQITVPDTGERSIRARTNSLGDPLLPGSVRVYQVWYRDVSPTFCVAAANFNATNAQRVVW